jgi:signal transduction histidine kinase
MLSYFAHEIGNPLNGILGFAQLMTLDGQHPLPPAQAERLQQITTAGKMLQALMRDVLDVNRFETGQFQIQSEPVELSGLVRDTLPALGTQATGRQVRIELQVEEAPCGSPAMPTASSNACSTSAATASSTTAAAGG